MRCNGCARLVADSTSARELERFLAFPTMSAAPMPEPSG
jgi:hypothetical protein